MEYKINHLNSKRLLIAQLGLIVSGFIFILINAKYDLIYDGMVLLIFITTLLGSVIIGFYWNDGIKDFKMDDKGISINTRLVEWSDIKSYRLKDENPSIETLMIKTSNNSYNITHRAKFKDKDDFWKLKEDFERKVNRLNERKQTTIIKEPSIWDTNTGKIYAYILIAIWIALLIVTSINFKSKSIIYFLIFTGGALPLVIRALKSSESKSS